MIPTVFLSLTCNRKRQRRKRSLKLNPKNKKRLEGHQLKRNLPKGRERRVERESPLDLRLNKKGIERNLK